MKKRIDILKLNTIVFTLSDNVLIKYRPTKIYEQNVLINRNE
jgi:hypothetical protein